MAIALGAKLEWASEPDLIKGLVKARIADPEFLI